MNEAVTPVLALRTTEQVPVPVQAPDQPLNFVLAAGAAVSTTVVPGLKVAVHVFGQLIPAGLLVITPFPVPVSLTAN